MSSYEPLYLKYRPQTLSDLIGQDSVKQTLVNAIAKGRLVHAYLFTGPRGAGKTSTARILAKCLNCLDAKSLPTSEPCGKCASCLDIASSSSLDVVEIDAASHGGVEDARALIERVNLGTISGNYKVYIIDEVHMLSTAAFNALLKVFEEPPERVVFILATTEEDKVLATIKSRCQTLQFRPITVRDCVERLRYVAQLEQININDDALDFIARRSDGAMRDALGLLDQAAAFSETGSSITKTAVLDYVGGIAREEAESLLEPIFKRDASTLLANLDELLLRGKEPTPLTRELINIALECLEKRTAEAIEDYELVQIIEQLSLTEEKLRRSTQAKNIFRAALLKLVYREDILVVRELLQRVAALESNYNNVITQGAKPPSAKAFTPSSIKTTEAAVAAREIKPIVAASDSVVIEAAASSSACVVRNDYPQSSDFTENLSPACRGLLSSSNARLASVNDGLAILHIPERFKFLKSKIETKATEILAAIVKTGNEVKTLNIEIVANDSQTITPPHLDASYQTLQARSLKADDLDASTEEIRAEKLELTVQQAAEREQAPTVETEKVKTFQSAKMQEAVSLAKSVFNAKILD